MDKMDKYGMDLEKVNIERLKEIFPECVTDGKVNFDALRTILGDDVETSGEKYSFNWVGKSDAMKIALMPSTGTLRPCKDKSKDWDKTENLYIEGDNLEVLKILEKTYHNQIKMIYIDPPYNTGKDFVYHDDFHDNIRNYLDNSNQAFRTNPETAGRFHTDWLNMMYPRLRVAKELLVTGGLIFISLDESEIANLRKMCDEVFGEENLVGNIIWKKTSGDNKSSFAYTHDNILVYGKFTDEMPLVALNDSQLKQYKNPDNDCRGAWAESDYRSKWSKSERPNLYYGIKNPNTGEVIYPDTYSTSTRVWAFSKEAHEKNEKDGLVWWGIDGQAKEPKKKRFLTEHKGANTRSIWVNEGTNDEGSSEVKLLLEGDYFDNPKPLKLLKKIISSYSDKDAIILDFFSGSGTTAHAVMALNIEEDASRKFVLVQLPEVCGEQSEAYKAGYKTICDIGEERIRRAGAKIQEALGENGLAVSMLANGVKNKKEIKNDEGETVAQLSMTGMFDAPENVEEVNEEMANNIDVGFKVFKLDSTNIKPWDATVKYDETTLYDLQDSVVKEDRSNLDIAYEVMLKYGIFNMPLEEKEVNGKTVYSVGEGYMIISLNDEITTEDVAAIAALNPKAVVFKESGFVNDNAKMNADYTFKRLGIDNVKCI